MVLPPPSREAAYEQQAKASATAGYAKLCACHDRTWAVGRTWPALYVVEHATPGAGLKAQLVKCARRRPVRAVYAAQEGDTAFAIASTGQLLELVVAEPGASLRPGGRGEMQAMSTSPVAVLGSSKSKGFLGGGEGASPELRTPPGSLPSPCSTPPQAGGGLSDLGFVTVEKGKKGVTVAAEDSTTARYSFRPVEGLRRVVSAAVGGRHALAIVGILTPPHAMLHTAGRGGVPSLVSLCEEAVKLEVDVMNASAIADLAATHWMDALRRYAVDYLLCNLEVSVALTPVVA